MTIKNIIFAGIIGASLISYSGCQKVEQYMNTPPAKWFEKEKPKPKRPFLDLFSSNTPESPKQNKPFLENLFGDSERFKETPVMLDSDGNYNPEYMREYMKRCPTPGHQY